MSQITIRFDKAMDAIKEIYDYVLKVITGIAKIFSYNNSILLLTVVLVVMALVDYPEYPLYGQRVTPTNYLDYIDNGDQLVHKMEYSIIKSKYFQFSDIVIEMPTDVQGFESIHSTRGYIIESYVNSSKGTVNITNVDGINPVLLDITYIERKVPTPGIVVMRPINPSSNESFYLFIRTAQYDIKHATVNYNLVDNASLWLNTTIYDSWKNQSIVIYENSIPFANPKVDSDGFVSIDIYSLKVGEYKSYLIKKY